MFSFSVMYDVVMTRTFRKKFQLVTSLKAHIESTVPGAEVFIAPQHTGTLREICELLIDEESTITACNWFISDCRNSALAAALLCVISQAKSWDVLDSEETFNTWCEDKVRG